jgi:Restriction endonuclease
VVDFYEHLAWIEDTPAYQWHFGNEFSRTATCFFCGGELISSPYHTASNGISFHRACYNRLVDRLAALKGEDEARGLFEAFPHVLCGIALIHTYWPTYPPDWGVRKKRALRTAGYRCEDCGAHDHTLDVHHIVPIANHSDDNLLALCSSCHAAYHRNRELGRIDPQGNRKTYSAVKDALLELAIEEKTDIRFDYIEPGDGSYRIHTATPRHLDQDDDCRILHAVSHVENEVKPFHIRRMSKLRLIGPKGGF